MKNTCDIGIRCDSLLTMKDGHVELLNDYFLGINDSVISIVEPWQSQHWNPTRLIESKNRLVMPGLINAHTHLPMSLFKGLGDDLPFSEWLNNYIIPLEKKLVDAEFVRVGTSLSALELIRSGITTVCDMYYFAHEIAQTLDQIGLRALVGEAILDFPTPDTHEDPQNQWNIVQLMQNQFSDHPRITPCIAPHAPYTCSDSTLIKARHLAKNCSLPILIHVAETQQEVYDSLKTYGKTPIERLHELGILGEFTILAHGIHLSDIDIEILSKTRSSVINNPESNMKLGSGVAPIPKLIENKIKLGIGTDGSASNNDLSIFREMDTAVKIQKLTHHNNTAMTAKQALSLATWSGAHALGLGKQVGSIEIGKKADVIILDMNQPHLQPIYDIASHLVYSASGNEVETVICDGKILFHEGKYTTLDPNQIYKEVNIYQSLIKKVAGV